MMNILKKRSIFILLVMLITISSCSKHSIGLTSRTAKKNERATHHLTNKLAIKNGNSFWVTSTYTNFSYVWSYKNNELTLYWLQEGAIKEKRMVIVDKVIKWEKTLDSDLILEARSCIELDGDFFGIKLMNDKKIEEQTIPVEISCFIQKKYESPFLNNVVDVINTHIGWSF